MLLFAATTAAAAHVANTVVAATPDAVKWTDSGIFWATLALAAVTLLLFVATYLVARRTNELGVGTLKGTTLADIHHQQSLYPMLVVDRPLDVTWDAEWLRVYVKNIGLGPAIECTLKVDAIDDVTIPSTMARFGSLGHLETPTGSTIDVRYEKRSLSANSSITFTLECKTLFTRPFDNEHDVTTWRATRIDWNTTRCGMTGHKMAAYSPTIPEGYKTKPSLFQRLGSIFRLRD